MKKRVSQVSGIRSILEHASQVSGVGNLFEKFNKKLASDSPLKAENSATDVLQQPKRKKRPKNPRKQALKRQRERQNANQRIISRVVKKLQKRGIQNPHPTTVDADTFWRIQAIVNDHTGKAIEEISRQSREKIALGRIHRAALCHNGEVVRSYRGHDSSALRARLIFATAYLLLSVAKPTRKKGQYNRLVTGIAQSVINAIVTCSLEQRMHRNTISGKHRYDGKAGTVGYIDELKASGFLYARQAIWTVGKEIEIRGWKDIQPEEIAGERDGLAFSFARYWLVTDVFYRQPNPETKKTLWLDYVAGCSPVSEWLKDKPPNHVATA